MNDQRHRFAYLPTWTLRGPHDRRVGERFILTFGDDSPPRDVVVVDVLQDTVVVRAVGAIVLDRSAGSIS